MDAETGHPCYYDRDIENCIIDKTQRRVNPRYEYLLPVEAEEKKKDWEGKNQGSDNFDKWNPLNIFSSAMKAFDDVNLGANKLYTRWQDGDIRQNPGIARLKKLRNWILKEEMIALF